MSGTTPVGIRSVAEGNTTDGTGTAVEKAKAEAIRLDAATRQAVGKWMIGAFGVANFFVLFLILRIFEADRDLLAHKIIPSSERVINSAAIMALIAGTTTQLGALALIIGKYLFPAGSADSGK